MNPNSVSIVVPCHRDAPTADACLSGILTRTRHPDWEVIVVTEPGARPFSEAILGHPRLRVLEVTPGNVARAVNAAITAAGARDIVRVHADVVVENEDWLTLLAEAAASQPGAGVVGARLVYPDGRIHSEGRSLVSGAGFHHWHRNLKAYQPDGGTGGRPQEVDGVPGALAYYRREAISVTGGFDERYGHTGIDDDDFCISARNRGFKVYVHPCVRGVHYTRCWAPSSENVFPDAETILKQVAWEGRQAGELRHARTWEDKWGWDPYYPDLHEIRRLYGHTEICWQIGEPMRYRAPSATPVVDCCIVTWNNLALLKRTLESLAKTEYPTDQLRVFITDNASTDGTGAYLAELARTYPFALDVQTLSVNTGAPIGLNFSIVRGIGELVARLDDDIVLPPDWLRPLVADFVARPFAGCVGPKILNDDDHGTIQCAAYRHFPGLFGHEDETDVGQADYLARTVHVRGCCNLYRRDVLKRCGLLDPRFSPSQFDDPDHHITLAVAGYEILYDGRVAIVHKLNNGLARSRSALSNQRGNAIKMYGKWVPEIFEILERSIDLSREGRYLPENGDTSGKMANAPDPSGFPKSVKDDARAIPGQGIYDVLARAHKNPELKALVDDYLGMAATKLRDGYPRQAIDILHVAVNFAPHTPDVFLALAETYQRAGQHDMARTVARRGLNLDPANQKLAAISSQVHQVKAPTVVPKRINRTNDRSDAIGESGVSFSEGPRANHDSPTMRVLMVNSFESRVAGGDMQQLKKTRQYLQQMGIQVDIDCTPRPDPRGYDVVHLWNTWFPHQTLAQAKAIRSLAPDIPIALSTIYWDMREKAWADLAVPELFRGSGSPAELESRLVALAQDRFRVNGRGRRDAGEPNFHGYEIYQRRLLELVDHLLPQSESEVRNLKETLGVSMPHTLVFNGAETGLFDSATPDWFIENYKVRDFVLTVGLIEARKNQLMLLHSLRDTGLPVVVVGRNYDRNYLRLCRRHAGPRAIFIEHLPHEHLASAFRAARVHALPSWMECASLANVEAALAGCSLAVSDRTSEREYFGDRAYYCNPADTNSIRQAVTEAIRNYGADAPKRAALRDQFRDGWTWPAAAAATLRGYQAALAARRAPGKSDAPSSINSGLDFQKGNLASSALQAPAVATASSTSNPVVSIIIPVLNRLDLTRQCLLRIRENTPPGLAEVIVVDNGSTDGTAEFLAEQSRSEPVIVLRNESNLGFSRACNRGARAASGRNLLFLNNDTEVQPGWIEPMVALMDGDPKIAAVGSKLLFPDGTIQHAGVALVEHSGRDPLLAMHTYYRRPAGFPAANERRMYQALTAACLMVRGSEFEAVHGFDEGFWNGYEDVDLCLRLQARGGWLVYEPSSVVVHHESQSGPARFERAMENIRRLHRRWLGTASLDGLLNVDGRLQFFPNSRIRVYPGV